MGSFPEIYNYLLVASLTLTLWRRGIFYLCLTPEQGQFSPKSLINLDQVEVRNYAPLVVSLLPNKIHDTVQPRYNKGPRVWQCVCYNEVSLY